MREILQARVEGSRGDRIAAIVPAQPDTASVRVSTSRGWRRVADFARSIFRRKGPTPTNPTVSQAVRFPQGALDTKLARDPLAYPTSPTRPVTKRRVRPERLTK